VLCRLHGITLHVADAGVNHTFSSSLPLHQVKVGYGTRNYMYGPAMTLTEVQQAIQHGRQLVTGVSQTGCNTIGFGEMGIGNSSSAALLMHHYTALPLEACTGAGTGVANERYQTKLATLQQVAALHLIAQGSLPAEEVLARVGGYELAMMCGAYLAAADHHMLVLVDGFIATAALLCARQLNPAVITNCLFAHQSGEKGHLAMLQYLQATPLLQLGMRLGEGTGSAMAVPLVKSALTLYAEMATFEAAAVSKSQ
jgi:nicotinate-nucleotide--dimethylbenzimidazole phosphoribosyltransferase